MKLRADPRQIEDVCAVPFKYLLVDAPLSLFVIFLSHFMLLLPVPSLCMLHPRPQRARER